MNKVTKALVHPPVETLSRRDEKKLRELLSMGERKMGRCSQPKATGSKPLEPPISHLKRDETFNDGESGFYNLVTEIPPPSFSEEANPMREKNKKDGGPVSFDGHVYWMSSECKMTTLLNSFTLTWQIC